MNAYADYDYYKDVHNGTMEEADAVKAIQIASMHIDTLTYSRIGGDINTLTPYQKALVQDVACMMADFESANGELINSLINSYSLNGASISFGGNSANCTVVNGIVVQKDVYAYLCQTGLCCASLGV